MPVDPCRGGAGLAELVVKIGPDVKVFAETDPDSAPVVCIQAGDWQVLFYPFSWAEDMRASQAEADRASEIVIAFSQWRNAIMAKAMTERDAEADGHPTDPV